MLAPYLLDTNILLAATIAPDRLPVDVAEVWRDPLTEVLFSAASLWELGVKCSLNRAAEQSGSNRGLTFYPSRRVR